jgi:PD-(D/E)XK endonuclease
VDTIRRGNAAEAAVLHRLIHAEIPVYLPFGGGSPVDLLALVPPDGRVVRMQVKSGRVREGCIRFNTCSTDHGAGRQNYEGRADVIAVYVHQSDSVYVVPVTDCPSYQAMLRVVPPRNNQRQRIRFADDYSFENWVRSLGDWWTPTRPPAFARE